MSDFLLSAFRKYAVALGVIDRGHKRVADVLSKRPNARVACCVNERLSQQAQSSQCPVVDVVFQPDVRFSVDIVHCGFGVPQ